VRRYAFFDVDGTLLAFNSMIHFIEFFYKNYYGKEIGNSKIHDYAWRRKNTYRNFDRDKLNRLYYENYCGIEMSFLRERGKQWFQEIVLQDKNAFNSAAINRLKQHQAEGDQIVLVSGSFFACLEPIAKHLDAQHILCTNVVVEKGCLTGEVKLPQTIGEGKTEAMRSFLGNDAEKVLATSFAYGDHISDLPMLQIVGNPGVIPSDHQLMEYAKKRSWEIIN